AMGAGAVELAAGFLVAHGRDSLSGMNAGTLDFSVAILALVLGLRLALAGILRRTCRGLGSVGAFQALPFKGRVGREWVSSGGAERNPSPSLPSPCRGRRQTITPASRGRKRPPAASSRASCRAKGRAGRGLP